MGQLHKRTWRTSFRLWWMLQCNKDKAKLWAMTSFGVSMAIAVAQIARGSSWPAIVVGSALFFPLAFAVLIFVEYRTDSQRMQASGKALRAMGANLGLKPKPNESDPVFRTRLTDHLLAPPNGSTPPAERNDENRPFNMPLKDWLGTAGCPSCGMEFVPMQLAERCPQCGLRPHLSEIARQRLSPYLARGRANKRPLR
jgi:hypothetical protein